MSKNMAAKEHKKDKYEDPGISFSDMSGVGRPRVFGRRKKKNATPEDGDMPVLTDGEKRAMRRAAMHAAVKPALISILGIAAIFLLLYFWLAH